MTIPKPRNTRRKLNKRFTLSYVNTAPDHRLPELALIDHRPNPSRFTVLLVGEEAMRVWELQPTLEQVLELARKANHPEPLP